MKATHNKQMNFPTRNTSLRYVIFLLLLTALETIAQAQTAVVAGGLGNFDIINNTGQDAHGFEVEIQGVTSQDIYYTYSYQRYGNSSIISTPTGVIVRWISTYDNVAQRFNQTTVPHLGGGNFQGTCYMGQANYDAAGCEHFGISINYPSTPTQTLHRWLVADPNNPGMLIGTTQAAAIPAPVYQIVPPVRPADPPQLEANFEAPEPPEAPEVYGDAIWVKVFKTQLDREVSLDELVTTNALVPQDAAHLEMAWDLVQASPPSNGNQRRHRNQGALDPTTRSVVRRYESYAFTGSYDPVTHQAICADGTCTAPAANEVGDFLGAQMAAANVVVNSVIVAKNGNGSVDATDRSISCGSKCASIYQAGSVVTLTATGKDVFTGWTGACTGTQPNCVVNVNGRVDVGATFLPQFGVSVSRTNSGTVTATPAGNDKALNCGSNCAAKFTQGTVVTFTATPAAGKTFINWISKDIAACNLSTSPTCAATINGNASIQAVFSK